MPNENPTFRPEAQPIVQPPAEDQPVVIPAPPPTVTAQDNQSKRYFVSPKGRRFIATLFGLLILVGGASAGILLVQQPQDVREKANIDPCLTHETPDLCAADTVNNCAWVQCAGGGPEGIDLGSCHVAGTPVISVCSGQDQTAVSCRQINIYDTQWNQLSTFDLRALKEGDTIYLTVVGWPLTEKFDKAKFKINNVWQSEVTTLKPGTTTEFYDQYTLPDDITSFTVEAQIYSVTLNNWI